MRQYILVGDINEIVGHRYNSRYTYNTSNNNSGTTTHPTTRNLSKKSNYTFFSFYKCSSILRKTGGIVAKFIKKARRPLPQ